MAKSKEGFSQLVTRVKRRTALRTPHKQPRTGGVSSSRSPAMRRITTRSACSGQVQGAASCCCAVSSSRLAIVVHRSSSLVRGSDRGWSIYRHGRVAATMESHRPERHEEIWRRRECGEPMSVTVERTSLALSNGVSLSTLKVLQGYPSLVRCCRRLLAALQHIERSHSDAKRCAATRR